MQEQQFHLLLGILLISFLLASFFFFVIWSLSKVQRQKKKEAAQQLNLLTQFTAQEKEKARITEQLHEDFGATLATVKMYINSFDLANERDAAHRQTATYYIDDMIKKIRAIALDYLPYFIRHQNLELALQDYVGSINKEHPHLVTLRVESPLPPLSDFTTVSLYRMVQEIVTNTIRHAKATELLITLRAADHRLLLKTKDNGIGFDYHAALESKVHMGLNILQTRVELLHGTLQASTETGGTLYIIDIPLAKESQALPTDIVMAEEV